ncbi:MAG: hypothetical protein KKD38_02665 [Candidatus Delongbacteria bacterium]|nr:hypothetical protein [Candidatus Delongbacteria bacterium]MCG2761017.1 hypothetical protein [Candidatus Delongbacteria bacterium]
MSNMKCGITQIDKHLDSFNYGEMIIMQRPEVFGIKDCNGREQIGLVELMLCAYDLCTNDYSYISFDKEKLTFENYDPDIHGGNRYIY